MSLDPLLPTAPARVRALVLPIGQITAERFGDFVTRLREEHVVCLRDVSADGRPNRNMFSPLAYPDGMMLYDLSTHLPPASHLALSPFDLFREPLAVVAVADGVELRSPLPGRRHSTAVAGAAPSVLEQNLRVLDQQLEGLRDSYPNALVHRVVIFEHDPKVHNNDHDVMVPEGIVTVPPLHECTRTTIKTVMCDLSSVLLAEMTSLARSFEALTHIESPGQQQAQQQQSRGRLADDNSTPPTRRMSHMPSLTRSSSAGGEAGFSRLSMPVPFRPPASGSQRPTTPSKSGLSNPPVTFDEMPAATESGRTTPEPPRPGTSGGATDSGLWGGGGTPGDRVSVQGFGPGSLSERLRSKGRGRAAVVVGSMYLQAGRWTDALRELNEAATIARSINDHIWHGKALELILVTVLLMGWAGLEFLVPPVLQPPPEKSNSGPPPSSYIQEVSAAQPRHLQQLQPIIPDLLDRILGLYSRINSESLPTLPLSESAIRFCKLLTALYLADGQLVKKSLDMMVEGTYPTTPPICPRLSVTPSKQQIIRLALRAFPTSSPELVTTIDRASVLSGIASVLGPLGAHRKKAMVMRELVSVLVTGLVEARTKGAAEVGIHPAAGLVALNTASANKTSGLDLDHGDVEQGIDGFLASLCASYGIVSYDVSRDLHGPAHAVDSATGRIQAHSAARFFGFPDVKLDVLRACINFCEALPDFSGVLRFAGDLLRTAGAGVAPGSSRREYAWPIISRDEQVRLVNTIMRASALAVRMGPGSLGEYWDEFLVRSVVLEPMAVSKMPIAQPKSLLPVNTTDDGESTTILGPKNPFIYNAFAQSDSAVDRTLVAGEPAAFRVTVQNPFDVELEIESIRIDAVEGDKKQVEAVAEAVTVGPYRTQTLRLWITPKEAGPLVVVGAVVKVRGCRERSFSIFGQAWAPKQEAKPKFTGTAAFSRGLHDCPAPSVDIVSLKVIPPQPLLVVAATSLPQSAMMVLEGERQPFTVTLRNQSSTTPADLLLFSFEDSTQEPLKAALKSRDATTAELYEYELALVKKQALGLRSNGSTTIKPGATAVFEFELLGRPGLTAAAIRINFGHLGVAQNDFEGEEFYTRQVAVQLAVTVNSSVELARLDVVAPVGGVPWQIWRGVGVNINDNTDDNTPDTAKDTTDGNTDDNIDDNITSTSNNGYCLAVLDLRNAFPALMTVRLRTTRSPPLEAIETILPGHAKRLILPVPRIHVADPFAPVPSLVPAARQRQFVVSRSVSADMERAAREAFWFREGVLGDAVVCEWSCSAHDGSVHPRTGEVDLRGIRLSRRMIDALRIDDVGIEIRPEDPATNTPLSSITVDEFIQLRIRLLNRSTRPIRSALRILPVLRHRPVNVALDHVRKFAWSGTLQRILEEIGPGGETEVVMGAVALCRGEFELGVTVEEVAGGEGRGMWSLRRPALVVVK